MRFEAPSDSEEAASVGEIKKHNRFSKLLKKSVSKRVQEYYFQLNSFVFTMAGSNSAAIYIFRILYFLQMALATFIPLDERLWDQSSLASKILNILSFFTNLIPASTEPDTYLTASIVITIIFFLLFVIFFYSFFSYSRYSKLSGPLVTFCAVFQTSSVTYLSLVSFAIFGKALLFYIKGTVGSLAFITIVFSLFSTFLCLGTYSLTAAVLLAMRPTVTSMMSMKFSFMYNIFECISFCVLLEARYFGSYITIGCTAFALVLTVINTTITFNNIIWQNSNAQNMHKSINITNMVMLLFDIIQTAADLQLSEIHIIAYVVLFSILYIVFTRMTKKNVIAKMALLDQLEQADSLEEQENMKAKEMVELLYCGFFNGHPFAHSWRGFDLALEKWPKDKNLITLLLRCASIYPGESQRLKDALIRAYSIKKGDYEMKKLIQEGQNLLQQRERNLSKSLKKQLNKIKEKSDKCIGHIRHIWECIIRGSVVELETLSSQLRKMEDDVTKDYNQLLSIYSNNPYVVRAFANFLSDVACNQTESSRYMHMYKTLRSGARILNEKSYFFALKEFPALPGEELHSQMVQQKAVEEMPNDQPQQERSVQSFTIGASDAQWVEDEVEGANAGYIESLVNTVRLPSLKIAKVVVFLLFVIVTISSVVPFVVIFNNRMDTCVDAYTFLHSISLSFTHTLQASLYAFQYVLNKKGISDSLKTRYENLRGSTDGMPETWESDELALRAKVQKTRELNEVLESVVPSIKSSGYFPHAITNMFEAEFNFNFLYESAIYDPANYYVTVSLSYQQFATYCINSLAEALNNPEASYSDSDFFSLVYGSMGLINISNELLGDAIEEYSGMLTDITANLCIYVISIGCAIMFIALCFLIYIILRNEHEKELVYSSFKAIPKSTISTIIQKLNVSINKNIDDSEENKLSIQEENALRLLSTSNSQKIVKGKLITYLIVPMIVFFVGYIAVVILLYKVPKEIYSSIELIPAALRDLASVPAYIQDAICCALRKNLMNDATFSADHPDSSTIVEAEYNDFLEIYPTLLTKVWTGSENDGDGLTSIGDVSEILSTSTCEAEDMANEMSIIGCCSFETGTAIAFQEINAVFDKKGPATVNDDEISVLLYYIEHTIIDVAVNPAYEISQEEINSMREWLDESMTVPCIVILVIVVLFGLFALTGIDEIAGDTIWSLRLLLFCHQQIILNSKAILKILSNDFSESDDDSLSNGTSFYETLVSHLLNGAIFLDNQLTIKSANAAVANILGVNNKDIIGKNLHDVLKAPPGKETGLHAFFTAVDSAMASLRSPDIECEADILKGEDTTTVQFTLVAVSISGEVQTQPTNAEGLAMIAIVMKDMTSTIAARTLLREEHDKGEHLLSMILPQIIVQKLQKGESNISFSVQSASILFMDIVSFTPWCGSLPAADVMKTLNKLFAVFDQNINRRDRMIKIKCIGDCYMAAGGIFDEVNQPAEHCKQAISFCLDAIAALELFDIENHLSLRIRAGINCGGPIIAGVLGIEKPTFDILGPAISIAAMMEHNGVPMCVHIPQHMYELVYDQPFQFKERGDIEIKGKPMHTYLVTGYE